MNWTIQSRALRTAAIVLLAAIGGCSTPDAPTANAMRAANTGDSLVSAAKGRCPGATAEIAAAESAAAEARAASQRAADAGKRLDDVQRHETSWQADGSGGKDVTAQTRSRRTAEIDAARNAWRTAAADANEKAKAARAANAALSRACPEAQAQIYPPGTHLPGSQPPGLDVFGSTTSQHQEP